MHSISELKTLDTGKTEPGKQIVHLQLVKYQHIKHRQDLPNLKFIGRATGLWKIHNTKANTC